MQLVALIAMLALAWAFLVLPQQRRVKAHREFAASLAVGDEVVTSAGVYGTVTALEDDVVRLRIAPEVEVTIARLAIGRHQPQAAASAEHAPTDSATE